MDMAHRQSTRLLRTGATLALILAASGTRHGGFQRIRITRPTPGEGRRAPLALDGLEAASKGDCHGAIDKLGESGGARSRADDQPCLSRSGDIQLGKLVLASSFSISVVAEPLTPNAPQPWLEAETSTRPSSGTRRGCTSPAPPPAERGQSAGDPQVTLDGRPIASRRSTPRSPRTPVRTTSSRRGALRPRATSPSPTGGRPRRTWASSPRPAIRPRAGHRLSPPQQGYGQPPAGCPAAGVSASPGLSPAAGASAARLRTAAGISAGRLRPERA